MSQSSLRGHEAELVDLLSGLGLEDKPARVIAYLASRGEARSVELEGACGLRQPEVSQATKLLRENYEWVVAEPRKTEGRGRPVNEYSLVVPLADIVRQLEEGKRAQIERDLERLERLREVASEIEL